MNNFSYVFLLTVPMMSKNIGVADNFSVLNNSGGNNESD
jgi:hypothetical protein